MKWVWAVVWLILVCSCKTQKVEMQAKKEVTHEAARMNETVEAERVNTVRSEQIEEKKVIIETIHIKEYDQDTGTVAKETKTTREVRQVTNQVDNQEEERKVTENRQEYAVTDIEEKIKSEQMEEDVSFYWKISGLIIGLAIALGTIILFIRYILTRNDNV